MKLTALSGAALAALLLFSFTNDPLSESIARGKEVYEGYCIACHQGTGEGVADAIPPLKGSDVLIQNPDRAIRAVKYGQSGKIVVNGITYNGYMPEPGLDDEEIADVINYVRNSWGNKNDSLVTAAYVAKLTK